MDLTPEQLAEYELRATMAERERCARIVEGALRADFRSKTGRERGWSEAESFFSKLIRAGRPYG